MKKRPEAVAGGAIFKVFGGAGRAEAAQSRRYNTAPEAAQQNERVQEARAAAQVIEGWLNYCDRSTEGDWLAPP